MDTVQNTSPGVAHTELAELSPEFRREIRRMVLALGLFAFVYLVMVVLALALTILCIVLGLGIIVASPHFITLLIGLGLGFMGVMVVFFLIKFLFAGAGDTESHGIEITEADEPRLFAFIREISDAVGTHFPKKVYLIPEVNASVFFHSSFWSLFFPVRKNLNIGLGLVNALNTGEFKAVLAHEFGHFSQGSMRFGSYVYYANQAIYNMLFRNTGWGSVLDTVAGFHFILYIFAWVSVQIVRGIQWVLGKMYAFVNRQYRGLSRQMEFHADAISAGVAGSNNAVQALRQLGVGDMSYQTTIQACNALLAENKAPANFYLGQQRTAQLYADDFGLELQHGLPRVDQSFLARQSRPRVVYTDQWASHPTQEEREAALLRLQRTAPAEDLPAWSLFDQTERWQRELTNYLYREVERTKPPETLDAPAFAHVLEQNMRRYQLPKVFRGYYDDHMPAETDLEQVRRGTGPAPLPEGMLDRLFGDGLREKIRTIEQDVQTLEAIAGGQIETKTFDFDGQKYKREQAGEILETLKAELEKRLAQRNRRDADILRTFYAHARTLDGDQAAQLLNAYQSLFDLTSLRTQFVPPARDIYETLALLEENGFELTPDLRSRFNNMRFTTEPEFRKIVENLIGAEDFDPALRELIRKYVDTSPLPFESHGTLHQTHLKNLRELLLAVNEALGDVHFQRLSRVLEMQAGMAG